jgi:hypothetical protein
MKPSLRKLSFQALACATLLALASLPAGCLQGGGTDVGNPEMRITGSIKRLDGSPAADIPLHLRPQTHLGSPDTTQAPAPAGGILQDGRTDTQGFFVFDSVPKGEYRIEAMDTNGRGAVIEVSAVGESPRLELKPAYLDSTGAIAGQINYLGEIKGGYPKITVAVYGMDRATFATRTGTYVLSDLPPGVYKLHISYADYHANAPATTLAAGQKVTVGTVDLGP